RQRSGPRSCRASSFVRTIATCSRRSCTAPARSRTSGSTFFRTAASAGCACMELWRRIDLESDDEARRLLQRACGSTRWVNRMLARRPFGGAQALLAAARDEWFVLSKADWLEAFSHHPKIGDTDSLRQRFAATHDLSGREQAGVSGASEETIARLADSNRRYDDRFGYIFIVCAT